MKLVAFFLLAGMLQVSARTTAQERISITLKGVTLDKAFAEIEKRSGYSVFYNVDVLKAATGLISIDLKDATIDDVLHQCLKGLPLEFTVREKTIFIKKEVLRSTMFSQGPGAPGAVSGVVRGENGAPLAGASVVIPKLKKSAATNILGEFSFKDVADGEYELEITFVGFDKFTRRITVVNHEASLEADLKHSSGNLDEVVFKGYYSTTNRLNTGDVTTVKGEDIQKQPVTDPILALEGRVPGLYIQQTSGVPGAYSTIRIRGQNSIANGNDPLYIIDGIPYGSSSLTSTAIGGGIVGSPSVNPGPGSNLGLSPFNTLNPSDIETVEVLKDADATAIYGSRGANGVILITTKKGKAGVTRFDVNVYSGVSKVARQMNLLNTREYLKMRYEAFANDSLPLPSIDADPFDYNYDIDGEWDTTRYTNWQKILIGNSSHLTSAQLNISGGSANTQFVVGGGYSTQGTVFPGNYTDRKASGQVNLTHNSTDQRFQMLFSTNYVEDNSKLPVVNFTSEINIAPDAPALYNSDGTLNWQYLAGSNTWNNPLSATYLKANAVSDNLITHLSLNYKIITGLEIKGNVGYSHQQMQQAILTPGTNFSAPGNSDPTNRTNASATTDSKSWIIEPQIDYKRRISKGVLQALVGTTFQQDQLNSTYEVGSGFASDALIDNLSFASTTIAGLANQTLYRYNAWFSRISYNWQEKYLINATARRDGSSRFGPGKQFGDFGAIGAAWVFSRENFIQKNLSFLSFGKLRASYGTTGNDQIKDYQYLSTYSSTNSNYQGITGFMPTALSNPNFAWELIRKLEGGIELGFLTDRLYISANYYRNRSGNQLVGYPLPNAAGFTSVQYNLPAIVQNTGYEFSLNTTNIKSKIFSWTSSINLSIPNNKLIAYPGLTTSNYRSTYVIGKSLFIAHKYNLTGVDPQTGIYSFATKNSNGVPTATKDYIVTSPVTQKFFGGFENTFSFRGFQLDILAQFVKQIAPNYLYSFSSPPGTFNLNQPTTVLDRWQSPGNKASIERFTSSFSGPVYSAFENLVQSNGSITDASFIRIKNLAFSYTLPVSQRTKFGLQNARIYLQCQNLLTFTKYLGLDPETQGLSLPPLRTITAGIQITL